MACCEVFANQLASHLLSELSTCGYGWSLSAAVSVARKLGSLASWSCLAVDFSGDDDGSWLFLRFGPGVSGLDFFCTKRGRWSFFLWLINQPPLTYPPPQKFEIRPC